MLDIRRFAFFSIISLTLVLFATGVSAEKDDSVNEEKNYQIGEELTDKEVDEIKESINSGEVMGVSASDENDDNNNLMGTKNWSFFGMNKDPSSDVEGDVSGTLTSTLGYFNHNTSWNIQASPVRGVTESRARGTIEGYGATGSDGVIGKVIDSSVDSGWSTNSSGANFTGNKGFTGAIVYVKYHAYGDFKHSGGTLTAQDSIIQNN